MRQELIDQTQEMAAAATPSLDLIWALRSQLFDNIDAAQEDPSQAERLIDMEKQLRDIDLAIGQVRIYLLGFHRSLASMQAIAQGNMEIPRQINKVVILLGAQTGPFAGIAVVGGCHPWDTLLPGL